MRGAETGVRGTNESRRKTAIGRRKEGSSWEASVRGIVRLSDRRDTG